MIFMLNRKPWTQEVKTCTIRLQHHRKDHNIRYASIYPYSLMEDTKLFRFLNNLELNEVCYTGFKRKTLLIHIMDYNVTE